MRTLKHVLDEDAALSDLLVDDELFIIGGDEKDHRECEDCRDGGGRAMGVDEGGECGGDAEVVWGL